METTPAALPLPPLTDEQDAAIHFRVESILESLPTELAGDGWPESHLTYDGVGLALEGLLAENTRLSLLLEEERRTGEVALKEAQERADAFRVSLIHSQQFLGQDLDTPRKQYEAKGVHTVTQRMLDDPKFGFYNPLIAQAFPAPAAPCQRDCQKCGEELGKKVGVVFVGQIEKGAAPAFDTADAVDPDWFPPAVFDSREDYDASVTEVVARIKSGQIKARTPQDSDESAAGGAGVGLQGEEGGGRG